MGTAYYNKNAGSFGVLNFRDLAVSSAENPGSKKYLKEGLIFRSATLDNMTQKDVDAFLEAHNICTILDLRTGMEGREGLPIDKSFPTTTLESFTSSALLDVKDTNPPKVSKEIEAINDGVVIRKKFRVDFAGKNFQRKCVFASCPFSLKLYIIFLITICQRKKAAYIIARRIMTPMGVKQMYIEFTTYCQAEIREALMVFTEPSNYPIEIHCTQGKDRTGIVSAFVLYIAGVPFNAIIDDYAKTERELVPIYDNMLEELRQSGLSEDFAKAPPQYMRDLLDFLITKYGSIDGFLDEIGFSNELREQVRKIVCIE